MSDVVVFILSLLVGISVSGFVISAGRLWHPEATERAQRAYDHKVWSLALLLFGCLFVGCVVVAAFYSENTDKVVDTCPGL